MAKIKVHEIAKEMEKQSREIIALAAFMVRFMYAWFRLSQECFFIAAFTSFFNCFHSFSCST